MYVFDDLDPVETNYLGLAEVSLLPLTQGHSIQDSFLLKNVRITDIFPLLSLYSVTYRPVTLLLGL